MPGAAESNHVDFVSGRLVRTGVVPRPCFAAVCTAAFSAALQRTLCSAVGDKSAVILILRRGAKFGFVRKANSDLRGSQAAFHLMEHPIDAT